jgi:hypothetical protein
VGFTRPELLVNSSKDLTSLGPHSGAQLLLFCLLTHGHSRRLDKGDRNFREDVWSEEIPSSHTLIADDLPSEMQIPVEDIQS